jgi:hypothetical protein
VSQTDRYQYIPPGEWANAVVECDGCGASILTDTEAIWVSGRTSLLGGPADAATYILCERCARRERVD